MSLELGSIYYKTGDEYECLLESSNNNDVLCGYYHPDISHNGKYLVCSHECSKYRRKKLIGKPKLVEINLLNKEIKEINLQGWFPRYSKSDLYILCKDRNGFSIIERESYKIITTLVGALEAYWIK